MEMGFYSAANSTNLATGGTPIAGGSFPGQPPSAAYDNDNSTFWNSPGFFLPKLTWIGYHFASPVVIVQFSWTSRPDLSDFQVPLVMTFDYSDDGSSWTAGCTITLQDSDWPVVSQKNFVDCSGISGRTSSAHNSNMLILQ